MNIKENTTNLLLFEKVEEIKELLLERTFIQGRKWMDLKCAINYTGFSSSTLDRAIRAGKLKTTKALGKRMFKTEWIDCFMVGK